MRYDMIQDILRILEKQGFDILMYSSAVVDLAAQKSKIRLLIKVFENIDSAKQDLSVELKKLAQCLDASPVILGNCSKTGKLSNDIVYDRYGIPSLSKECFENCLDEIFPGKKYSKGREIVEIRGEFLKSAREKEGLTMNQLAKNVGVTKNAIYMYETGRIKPQYDIAKQMQEILDVDVIERKTPFETPQEQFIKNMKTDLHKKFMLFDFQVYDFNKMNFDMALKDKKDKIILEERPEKAEQARQLSDFFKAFFALISKNEKCDIPSLTKKDILETDSKKEFIKLLKEKSL